MAGANTLMPVTLPPGRLRLGIRPAPMGSPTAEKTIGMVEVDALAASADGVPPAAKRRATRNPTSSAASAGNRSYRPSAQRKAIRRFSPSTNPASRRPSRNALTTLWDSLGERPLRNPMTEIAACCARAARGHAAAPPSSVMNSRGPCIRAPQLSFGESRAIASRTLRMHGDCRNLDLHVAREASDLDSCTGGRRALEERGIDLVHPSELV